MGTKPSTPDPSNSRVPGSGTVEGLPSVIVPVSPVPRSQKRAADRACPHEESDNTARTERFRQTKGVSLAKARNRLAPYDSAIVHDLDRMRILERVDAKKSAGDGVGTRRRRGEHDRNVATLRVQPQSVSRTGYPLRINT